MRATKARTVFVCQSCGASTPRWLGRCPECESWNTLVETLDAPPPTASTWSPSGGGAQPVPLSGVPQQRQGRIPVSIAEFNRVLGGGIVPGSVVLLGGDPGIGKSTLLLLVSARVAASRPVIYASGEESVAQVGLRAQRLALRADALGVVADTDLASILALAAE